MLQIEIDNGSGFCFGVTTAIKKAEEELQKGGTLYCLGDIVHNGMEVERLHARGLITIDHQQLRRLHNAKVLLRAHGEHAATTSKSSTQPAPSSSSSKGASKNSTRTTQQPTIPNVKSSFSAKTDMRRSSGSSDRHTAKPSSSKSSTTSRNLTSAAISTSTHKPQRASTNFTTSSTTYAPTFPPAPSSKASTPSVGKSPTACPTSPHSPAATTS